MPIAKDEIERRLTSFREFCQSRGFKVTPQRLEIFRIVAQTDQHPKAEAVCDSVRRRMPTMSADTVYRTLAFLEKNGLIRKLSRLHGSARFDGNVRKHHHFVCTECGGAWDFYCRELDCFPPPPEVETLGTVVSVHAELHGVCKACQAAKGGETPEKASPAGPGKNRKGD